MCSLTLAALALHPPRYEQTDALADGGSRGHQRREIAPWHRAFAPGLRADVDRLWCLLASTPRRAALGADGVTVAVLACRVDVPSPIGHKDLLDAIAARLRQVPAIQ
jgi:hypothetical protein